MKFGKLLSLLFALLISGNCIAAVVQPDVARNVARNFMYERYVQKGLSINPNTIQPQLLKVFESNGVPSMYVFTINEGGWIIISAEDLYTPVIGYSTVGNFPSNTDANYNSFLKSYIDQIDFARTNNIKSNIAFAEQWDSYNTINSSRMDLTGSRDVAPLLSILWNQDFPYNAYCPEDAAGPGGRVYAGCVATAMSMIMYYYRYPEVGTGTFSYYASGYGTQTANFGSTYYAWNSMQNTISTSSGKAINAVAEIQYHCGVSVRMMYGPDGSGTYSNLVPNAIKNYFGYPSASYMVKQQYSLAAWENTIKDNLNAKKPVYYSGQSSEGGHAFVCDGYQETGTGNMYHFNFGWSGSGNNYYTLADVNGFSASQAMVVNFVPDPSLYPYYKNSEIITSHIGSIEDGSGPLNNYRPNQVITRLIAPADSVVSITLTIGKFNLGTGDNIYIFEGGDDNGTLVATYNQGSVTAPVTVNGRRMFIKFVTDGNSEADGFDAEFTSVLPSYCSTSIVTYTEPVGYISDGSGNNNYNHNLICKWRINPGPWAKDLTLAFTSFDLEEGKDFLKVYSLPSNTLLAELTGNTLPAPIVSASGQMILLFSTNQFNNGQGFEANYYISNVNTSNEDVAKNLSIYPNPATTYTEVKFTVVEPVKVRLSLHNLLGEEIYSEPAQIVTGQMDRTIQLGKYPKGVYLLKLSSDKGTITRKLVVK